MSEMKSLTLKRTDGTVLGEYDSFVDQTAQEEIEKIKDSGQNPNGGLSTEAAALLITILRNATYPDDNDQFANITALEEALASDNTGGEEEPDTPVEPDDPEVTLTSISATYSGGSVPVGTAVSALTGIVVTAHYSDGTSQAVSGYTLSGTIAEGSNTITVSYGGMNATFSVTGVAESGGDSHEGVASINHLAARTDEAVTPGANYIEPDNGYIIITNTSGHTGLTAGETNLFAWPLISGKTYNISVANADTENIFYGLCASTLDITPVRGEVTTVTDTVVGNIAAWGWTNAESTKSYTYTAGNNEYLLFWPNRAGVLTITAEVTA